MSKMFVTFSFNRPRTVSDKVRPFKDRVRPCPENKTTNKLQILELDPLKDCPLKGDDSLSLS